MLRRAQKQLDQMDERELQVCLTGYRYATGFGMTVCMVLMLFKLVLDQPWQDVYAIICSMECVQNLYLWRRLKEKQHLTYAILWRFSSLALLTAYLLQIF